MHQFFFFSFLISLSSLSFSIFSAFYPSILTFLLYVFFFFPFFFFSYFDVFMLLMSFQCHNVHIPKDLAHFLPFPPFVCIKFDFSINIPSFSVQCLLYLHFLCTFNMYSTYIILPMHFCQHYCMSQSITTKQSLIKHSYFQQGNISVTFNCFLTRFAAYLTNLLIFHFVLHSSALLSTLMHVRVHQSKNQS